MTLSPFAGVRWKAVVSPVVVLRRVSGWFLPRFVASF